jgi:hypothetical protein
VILNVTPEEYRNIKDFAHQSVNDLTGQFNESEWQQLLWTRFGLWSGHYEVVVRYDVPSIPWLTKGVHRLGPDRDAWGGTP